MYSLDRSLKYDAVILKCFDTLTKWHIPSARKIYFGFLRIGRPLNCSFKKKTVMWKLWIRNFGNVSCVLKNISSYIVAKQ